MPKTYHFIGIKGSGMSALALMLHQMGHKVQGSDVEKYYFTQRGLEQAGITILPFDEKNLDGDMEIIAGNAFRPDNNVEIAYADQNGISYKRYHEFLGSFMRDFQTISQVSRMFSMPLTTMLNKLPKVCLSTVKMLNCVRLRLMLRFITMVLKQKVMTL